MGHDLRAAITEWSQADNGARAAEQLLVFGGYEHTVEGVPIAADLIKEAARLRATANDKLTVAIGLMQTSRAPK